MKNNLESRHCPHCGQPAAPTWKHCPACGKNLSDIENDGTRELPEAKSTGSQKDDRIEQAILKLRLGELAGAEEILASFLHDFPHDAQLLALLGSVYLRQYRIDEAKQYLDQAILSAPDSIFVRFKLVEYWIALGIPSRAFEELTVAEKHVKNDMQSLLYIRSLSKLLRTKTRGNVLLQPDELPGNDFIETLKGFWRNTPLGTINKGKEVSHEL